MIIFFLLLPSFLLPSDLLAKEYQIRVVLVQLEVCEDSGQWPLSLLLPEEIGDFVFYG